MATTAQRIVPGGSVDDAVKALDLDPARDCGSREAFEAWMQEKAAGCGLRFSQPVAMTGKELDTKEIDSYAKFMLGAYRLAKLGKRFHRPIGAGKQKVNGGWSLPINETIDASVFARWNRHSGYRPHNLQQWGERNGRRIETINGEQRA